MGDYFKIQESLKQSYIGLANIPMHHKISMLYSYHCSDEFWSIRMHCSCAMSHYIVWVCSWCTQKVQFPCFFSIHLLCGTIVCLVYRVIKCMDSSWWEDWEWWILFFHRGDKMLADSDDPFFSLQNYYLYRKSKSY